MVIILLSIFVSVIGFYPFDSPTSARKLSTNRRTSMNLSEKVGGYRYFGNIFFTKTKGE